jgi:catechol 2,3-dioxygenase-like lactoylglutathione lyase family enzyme
MDRPAATLGLRHVALNVRDIGVCEHFYVDLLGMVVEWRPDADNVYLTSGNDNLALHRVDETAAAAGQRLDHVGFFIATVPTRKARSCRLFSTHRLSPEKVMYQAITGG